MTATALDLLAERARATDYEPWLFHRDGWDWRWRSWGRVADHVARGVEALRAHAEEPRRAGYAVRQDPDAVTAGLTIQAAGWTAVPIQGGPREASALGCDVWVGIGDQASAADLDCVTLPSALSALDRAPPRSLKLEAAPGSVRLPSQAERAPAEWIEAAEHLDDSLAPGSERDADCRPIVGAVPDLDLADAQLLEVWTLLRGAAWVLEPQTSAFVETVLWARPTVVWARAAELERLAARLRVRKHRRRSRLSSVVAAGAEEVDQEPWGELGIEVVALAPLCRTAV